MLESIIDNYPDHDIYILENLDDAIIGYHQQSNRVIYSVKKIIELIIIEEKLNDKNFTLHDAMDYFGYNIESNGCGEFSPILCYDNFEL
jgi:hypothetical protein